MIRLLFDAAMAVYLFMQPYPLPARYTASEPGGAAFVFDPQRGWISPADCGQGCWVPAGTDARLLFGEFGLQTLADLNVTISRNGEPVFWCYKFFGDRPVCSVKQE